MHLEGWNHVPEGYGAWFDLRAAPLWLRLWFRTPILDKFARPVVVRRGFGHLIADPGSTPEQLGTVGSGWRIERDDRARPGVVTPLLSIAHPGGLRRRRRRYARAALLRGPGRWLTPPGSVRLPGGHLLERHAHLFWRIRLPLWAVLGGSGALIGGWPGVTAGIVGAVVVEVLFSYRRPRGSDGTGTAS